MTEIDADGGSQGADPETDSVELLTRIECDVLELLDAQLSCQEIASLLGISSETVRRLAHTIYRKLTVGTRRIVTS
jgi:DNA-binding NarL/FixJ family response regulator